MESVFEFIFSNAAEGIMVVNADSELIHLNPAAAAMLEINPESTIGLPVWQTFNTVPRLLRLLTIGGPRQLDVQLPHERLAQGIADDTENGRTVLLHDVTEQRELESRREVLVKKIAHDLRNPLNALNGYANLVEKSGDLNELQSKFLTRIQQTTIKMYEMASKLIDLAWIEAGMPLMHVPVEL
ncbi:MAG TPA: histidine kinase dimerization/phospho-acceptor domain-containing protein, partial [Aggregatilineales bacterium]|nr:histidine kinase dimerization/phospho-acceptor domain-containing protein [Aggregatilineales bacterium]